MKSGFVNIFGQPNAGKSTLLNALIGEKMAIVSHKVQTTRHRIKAILNEPDYQIVFSDTPGIIEPRYRLHEKMMASVKGSVQDSDVALYLVDVNSNMEENAEILQSLRIKAPVLLVINKIDKDGTEEKLKEAIAFFENLKKVNSIFPISAKDNLGTDALLKKIVELLPEGEAFYDTEDLSDMPAKFFVSEIIREKIFEMFHEELPYQTTVLIQEYKEKATLTKIVADIIVHRDTQKFIIIGHKGSMIKELGTRARKDIEEFIDGKVFLELFVKVRPKWRDNDVHLKEYGY